MHGDINYIELGINNIEETLDFYKTLFNWKFTESFLTNHRYFMFETPSNDLSGAFDALITPSLDGVTVYILVEDIEFIIKEINLSFKSSKIIKPKSHISEDYGCFALIVDPSGNKIGLHENPKS
ncbi:MAG: VOC family protein [Candidatus Izemoplasmataceae bacterium]